MGDRLDLSQKTFNGPVVKGALVRRPTGIVLVSVLMLMGGVFVAFRRALMIGDVYAAAEGAVAFSESFRAMVLEEILTSAMAIMSAIGLLIRAKWGWWLGVLYWSQRIGREVFVPLAVWHLPFQPIASLSSVKPDISRMIGAVIIQGLIYMYLFRANVLDYIGIDRPKTPWTILSVFCAGVFLSVVIHVLKTTIAHDFRAPMGW